MRGPWGRQATAATSQPFAGGLVAELRLILAASWDCSPPGSSVHGILQARILEWVAIPFSRDLPDPGIKPWSLGVQANSLPSEL